jgi:hypothetical protein
VTDGRAQIALARLAHFVGRQVNDDPERPLRIDLAGPADDIGLRIIIEIALGEGRGIGRVEELPNLVGCAPRWWLDRPAPPPLP